MGHPPRLDQAGSWHHVMNRGIARRTLFETSDDIRFFLSRLAGKVRDGSLEIHTFCVLTTHDHALVRSLRGELSSALRDVQNEYVRRFNRRRRRDGPLVRGRYFSRPVLSLRYRRIVVGYIDDNPVSAGLALLRELCGTTYEEAVQRAGCSSQVGYSLHRHHRQLILDDDLYAERIGAVAAAILAACHGAKR